MPCDGERGDRLVFDFDFGPDFDLGLFVVEGIIVASGAFEIGRNGSCVGEGVRADVFNSVSAPKEMRESSGSKAGSMREGDPLLVGDACMSCD